MRNDKDNLKLLIICPYFFEPHRWMISAYKTALYLSKRIPVAVLTTGTPKKEQINPNLWVFRMWDIFIPDPVNYSIVPGLLPSLLITIFREKPTHYLVNKNMFFTSFSIPILRLLGKKVITATDTYPGINWQPRNRYVGIIMTLYAKLIGMPLLKMSNKVVLYHDGLIDIAKQYKLNYIVIPNGVDLEKIDDVNPNPEFSDPKKTTVLYAGRLESVKGYLDILSVAKKITESRKDVEFILVGTTEGKEELVNEWQSDQIIFTNHRTDVIALMKAADIFLLASYSEGLPNALMEAMACGLACVSSSVGGVLTLIKSEDEGLLFPAGDQANMQHQIEKLVDNPAQRKLLGKNARNVITSRHDWAKIAEQYEDLLQKIT